MPARLLCVAVGPVAHVQLRNPAEVAVPGTLAAQRSTSRIRKSYHTNPEDSSWFRHVTSTLRSSGGEAFIMDLFIHVWVSERLLKAATGGSADGNRGDGKFGDLGTVVGIRTSSRARVFSLFLFLFLRPHAMLPGIHGSSCTLGFTQCAYRLALPNGQRTSLAAWAWACPRTASLPSRAWAALRRH